VTETVNEEGNILHLPYPGTYLEQPPWYREAVNILRENRNKYRKEQAKKK